MQLYREKTNVIEATQYILGKEYPELTCIAFDGELKPSINGTQLFHGDYIIKTAGGNFLVCRAAVFQQNYELVEEKTNAAFQ